MEQQSATIKGVFVKSHVQALRDSKGKSGIEELQRRYGKPLVFGAFSNIPVHEEIAIIDHIMDILHGNMPAKKRAFEAGRLHFRNFLRTPFAKVLFTQSRITPKITFLMAGSIGSQVFKGITFTTEGVGKQTVRITMQHSPYPLEHFQGFFQEWLLSLGYIGSVTAQNLDDDCHEYLLDWHQAPN